MNLHQTGDLDARMADALDEALSDDIVFLANDIRDAKDEIEEIDVKARKLAAERHRVAEQLAVKMARMRALVGG